MEFGAISAWIAAAVALVSACIQLLFGLKQARDNNRLKMIERQQRWVDEFTEAVAEYVGIYTTLDEGKRPPADDDKKLIVNKIRLRVLLADEADKPRATLLFDAFGKLDGAKDFYKEVDKAAEVARDIIVDKRNGFAKELKGLSLWGSVAAG